MHKANKWYELLRKNYLLFNEETKFYVDKFNLPVAHFITTNFHDEFSIDNESFEFFGLDGWSSEAHSIITEYLETTPFEKVELDPDSKILFYNDAEGYCTDNIFDAIHWIIKSHNLDPKRVVYRNLAMNNQELYDQYCDRKKIKNRITCVPCYTYNNSNSVCYERPTSYTEELPVTEKKLFINLNWNAWKHRLAAISIFNYFDLIDDAHMSSPCANKFRYDHDADFYVLLDGIDQTLKNHKLYHDIRNKLFDLKPKYPLMIDDRSKYPHTDAGFFSGEVKVPVFTARYNSLFEVVTETHANGPVVFHEKSYWPIMENKPFFHISSMRSLYYFKKLGYKTFSDYVDESYDEESDLIERIIMIAKELVRLKELRKNSPDDFYSMYEKILEITAYNKSLFYDRRAV